MNAPGRALSSLRGRLALLACAVVISLALAELAVRLLVPQKLVEGETFYRTDPELGWTLSPGYRGRFTNGVDFDVEIRIDDNGLRGGIPQGRQPTVLGLGDSFMFGFGVEQADTFLAVASRAVGARPVNAGVPGYDLCQATDLGLLLLDRIPVDAVVVAPCLANDELDVVEGRRRVEVQHGRFVEPGEHFDPDAPTRRLLHPIFAHSHFLRLLRYSPLAETASRTFRGKESIDRRSLRKLVGAFLAPIPEEIARGQAESAACLGRLSEAAAARGLPVLALLVPDPIDVDPDAAPRIRRRLGEPDLELDPQGPRRRFTASLAALGIETVDPSPELLAAAAAGERLWFQQDRHFNPTGTRLLGRHLAGPLARALESRRDRRAGGMR